LEKPASAAWTSTEGNTGNGLSTVPLRSDRNLPTIFFGRGHRGTRLLAQAEDVSLDVNDCQARFFDRLKKDIGLEAFDLLSDVFLFVKDADRRFVYYNLAFQILMSLSSPSELIGRRDEDVSPEYLVEHYRRHDEDVLNGATLSDIVELVQNSSEGYDWFVTSKFPARDSSGNLIGVVGVTRKLCVRDHRPESNFASLTTAVELMLRDYQRHISVDELASAACLSVSEFSRSFKRHFGLSPHQYLREIRVDAACELLATSEHCLSVVAARTGFYDQSHMTNTFVRTKGISPRRYREKFALRLPVPFGIVTALAAPERGGPADEAKAVGSGLC
jgi:AraC-like DNA-binding protein